MNSSESWVRRLAFTAALLFLLGAFTGILIAAAASGDVHADRDAVLASHLNALLGCFWLLAVAYTLSMVEISEAWRGRMCAATVVAAYGNWLVTLIKAFLGVSGIAYVGEPRNDVIFGLLTLTVIVPTFTSAGLWTLGLWRGLRRGSD